ncbi:type VI secretion protein [Streptomyces lavendulae]|uniref:type VI secretion protein n=1 Tax=Streptomyces lavendulae TaxID=1914 RepID=UPI00368CB70C
MPDARRTEPPARAGGIPDGVLVGLLAFLLGLAVLVWSATGLAALFSKGAWPATVTFTRTPGAVRALIAQPHDIAAAWPDTDPAALSGWGLFWGLFISQLLVALVLTIFTLGVVARTKARHTKPHAPQPPEPTDLRTATPPPGTTPYPTPTPGTAAAPYPGTAPTPGTAAYPTPGTGAETAPYPGTAPGTAPTPGTRTGTGMAPGAAPAENLATAPGTAPAPDPATAPGTATAPYPATATAPYPGTAPAPGTPLGTAPAPATATAPPLGPGAAPATPPATTPGTASGTTPIPAQDPAPTLIPGAAVTPAPPRPTPNDEAYRYGFGYPPRPPAAAPAPADRFAAPARLAYATPAERHRLAAQAIASAEGAVLVVTSSPALWSDTKDARAKLGPVLLYDPSHLCDTPARMHWNPADGCADRDTAAARAIALLAPVRPQARLDAAVADTAETLLRSWLQAAALDGRPFKQLHRWAQGNSAQDPVRILRTHLQAAPGAAGELESALTGHPERREQAQHLTARALSCLTSIHIREACTPNRTDALTLASFVAEGGSLYVVGEPLEDPRTHPGAMPLLTALASSVVEHGRRVAVRSSAGRLDPPLTLVLEDVAAVAPVPQLPELLTDETLPLLALCRSREQARAHWPAADLP